MSSVDPSLHIVTKENKKTITKETAGKSVAWYRRDNGSIRVESETFGLLLRMRTYLNYAHNSADRS